MIQPHLPKTVAIMALSLSNTLPALATNYEVYLLAGQSNMDGRGKVTDLSAEQRQPFANVSIYYHNPALATDGWKPLEPGYSIGPGVKQPTLPGATFGPEIGFAQVITKAQPHRQFAIIKVCKGGTSLAKDWNPDNGKLYRGLIESVRKATALLTKDGHTYTIRGLLWHQGESDAAATAEVYGHRLVVFIARVRQDLQLPNLPVIVGEVFDNGKRDGVRQAQRAAAQTIPNVWFVPATGFKTSDNGTHFTAATQLLLGERFAQAVLGKPGLFKETASRWSLLTESALPRDNMKIPRTTFTLLLSTLLTWLPRWSSLV